MINSTLSAVPAKNLQGMFESAVRDIYQVSLTGKASPYRTPIVQRANRVMSTVSGDPEKRALTDAAKALAQLWKVAPVAHR